MKIDSLNLIDDLYDENSASEYKALIVQEEPNRNENFLTSERYKNKESFLENLFKIEIHSIGNELVDKNRTVNDAVFSGMDKVILSGWKNVENVAARTIDIYDQSVVLECLIDKENGLYEEREFRIGLFEGFYLKIGSLFLLRFFERQNEIRLEIHNDPELTLSDDFPKISFFDTFKNNRILKKQ